MPSLISAAVEYGGYISQVKFSVLAVMFFAWMPLVNWVHADAQAVRTRVNFWTTIVSATGAGALIIWLLAPFFLIGLLLYIIAVGATALAYIIHRNSRVSDFEKVLTVGHIKSLFVDENKKIATVSKGMSFITANNNEVPLPKPKSPDAFGFKSACEVFEDALWRRASDIVFQPKPQGYSVIYRVDGVAMKQPERSREDMEYFIHYLKLLADLDVNQRRKPQTGTFQLVKDSQKIPWGVTTAGSTAGEQVRLIKLEEYRLMKLDDIGLNPDQLEPLLSLGDIKSGLVIASGPKKSGVTSTLYALLRNHDPFMNNINTLERRPAAELGNITQHTFALSDSGTTTYARKLQSILRMGPDIVGIEDCSEALLAQLACAAVNDGKIIYVTIEASSIIQALGKWLKLVPDKELLAQTLVGVLNQRLVRKLCSECRQAYQPNPELLKKLNMPADKIKLFYRPGEIEYDKHGKPLLCENCQGTGFLGRTGIFETIVLNDELKAAIKQAKSLQEISSHFRRAGMLYMQEQSIKRVAQGVTSINEVIREFSTQQKQVKKRKMEKKE